MNRSLALGCLLLAAASSACAEVRCGLPFGDHMVLQAGQPLRVYGVANPGEPVSVTFAGETGSAVGDGGGSWEVTLPALPASAEPRPLTVRGRYGTLRYEDVLVGEVWFCSGQSNMEKPLGPRPGQQPTDGWREAIAAADHPALRLFVMPYHGLASAEMPGSLRWLPCSPRTLGGSGFSAAAYYFGAGLQRQLGVPVGLIDSTYGGTRIEPWIPAWAFGSEPALAAFAKAAPGASVEGVRASTLYQSMIDPFVPFAVRGWLWYQGESNLMVGDIRGYAAKMRALIAGWRRAWREPEAPFYFVQIAPFRYTKLHRGVDLTPQAEPLFWEAQARALELPHTGEALTLDITSDVEDIHPTDKRDVGLRLAGLALSGTYGRAAFPAAGPAFAGAQVLPGGAVAVKFDHVGAGLATRDRRPPAEFQVAGADRAFAPAQARIQGGDTVLVWSPQVPHPVAVRYAWTEIARTNLQNSDGLPAAPFRTDDWPVDAVMPTGKEAGTGRQERN